MQLSEKFIVDRITDKIHRFLDDNKSLDPNKQLDIPMTEFGIRGILDTFKNSRVIRDYTTHIETHPCSRNTILNIRLVPYHGVEFINIQVMVAKEEIKIFMGDVCDII